MIDRCRLVLNVCLLLLVCAPAAALSYYDFNLDNCPLGEAQLSGHSLQTEAFGDRYAAVVQTCDGGATTYMQIWDLADPESPRRASTIWNYKNIYDILGDGDLLVVADALQGLILIGAVGDEDPAVLGSVPLESSVKLGSAAGNFFALSRVEAGQFLFRLDASDPASPSLAAVYEFELDPAEAGFSDLSRRGGRLMAWMDDRVEPKPNLIVFDVGDPSSPSVLWAPNLFQLDSGARMLRGMYWRDKVWVFKAYVTNWYTGTGNFAVDVYDIADPANPVPSGDGLFLRSADVVFGGARGMGDWIYVHFNGTTPIAIGLDGDQAVRYGNMWWYSGDVDLAGSTVVNCPDTILHTSRIGDLARLGVNAVCPDDKVCPFYARIGDHVYYLKHSWYDQFSSRTYLKDVDANSLDAGKIGGGVYVDCIWSWKSVCTRGDRIFYIDGSDRFGVVDPTSKSTTSIPATSIYLYSDLTGGYVVPSAMAGCGDHLLISTRNDAGCLIWDLSDPAAPEQVATVAMPTAGHMDVHGDILSALMDDGLHVFDVSDPLHPAELGHNPQVGGSIIRSAESLVCGLDGDFFFAVDLADPSQPGAAIRVKIPGARHLDVGEGAAYVVDDWGVNVIDIRNHESPVLKGIDNRYYATAVHCVDDDLWLMGSYDNLTEIWASERDILDIDAVPLYLSQFTAAVAPDGAHLTWRVAADAVAADFRLVARVPGAPDRAVPFALAPDGSFTATDPAAAAGETVTYALYRTGAEGWELLGERSLELPSLQVALEAPVPNPFNPSTKLSFTLDREQQAELAVYDVSGRKVRTLLSGRCCAGRTEIEWNGCGDGGRPLASGVYFARLTTEGATQSRKMALMK